MSDIEREEFLEWWESRHYDDEDKEVKKAAWCAWQAARQAPASGEVEPACWLLLFESNQVHGVAYNMPDRNKWLSISGRKAAPLYTHPPAMVPEDVLRAWRALMTFHFYPEGMVSTETVGAINDYFNLLTTPHLPPHHRSSEHE